MTEPTRDGEENALVDCAVCGNPLTEDDSNGLSTHGEPCHRKCAAYDWIAERIGLAQTELTKARSLGFIDETTEAEVERLLRHTEDRLAEILS